MSCIGAGNMQSRRLSYFTVILRPWNRAMHALASASTGGLKKQAREASQTMQMLETIRCCVMSARSKMPCSLAR